MRAIYSFCGGWGEVLCESGLLGCAFIGVWKWFECFNQIIEIICHYYSISIETNKSSINITFSLYSYINEKTGLIKTICHYYSISIEANKPFNKYYFILDSYINKKIYYLLDLNINKYNYFLYLMLLFLKYSLFNFIFIFNAFFLFMITKFQWKIF